MKTKMVLGLVILLAVIPTSFCRAETGSLGIRGEYVSWKEKDLFPEEKKASGMMYGPTFLFRFGSRDAWSVEATGLYGEFEELSRANVDLKITYNVSNLFGIFADFKYLWYEYDGTEDADLGDKVNTSGFGGGLGVDFETPIGDSPIFVFANAKVMPMWLDLDVEDADDNAFLWSYEAGLAWAYDFRMDVNKFNVYLAAGFRQQQMRGDDIDESISAPFAEFGFKQEF